MKMTPGTHLSGYDFALNKESISQSLRTKPHHSLPAP